MVKNGFEIPAIPVSFDCSVRGESCIRVPLLAWGNGWLAVDKPSGVTVHNQPGTDLCTMLTTRMKDHPLASQIGFDPAVGIHPVHRLDSETSGVILLACEKTALRELSRQMGADATRKRYLAILHGRLPAPSDPEEWMHWSWPLTKSAGGRRCPAGDGPRLPSLTRVRVARRTHRYTLAVCELATGRKHQIRRHAKLAGHAVVGDDRYGTRRSVAWLRDVRGFRRLALHAVSLTIQPPGATAALDICSPALPGAMQALLDD